MSGGGGKLEVINTRERAVSDDINRLQAFLQYDRAELARRLLSNRNAVFTGGGGVQEFGSYVDTTLQDGAAVGTPLRADVIDGLVVLPQPTSLNLLVSPGNVWLDDPDGQAGSSDPNPPNPDDSRAKLVVDPGVQLAGSLVIGAGSGSIRLDVIECQRTTSILETDSRDVYDPSTGVFLPVTVTKVTEGRLSYRVRAGTPGSGLPANVQGWLPLCVVSVPSTATSVDDCTFWDVRPLVKDRIAAGTDIQSVLQPIELESYLNSNDFTDTTKTLISGIINSRFGMYKAGGAIGIDVQAAANQAGGSSFTSLTPWYLWAIFPGGLPRWVQYNAFPLARVPNGPRGILAAYQFGAATDLGFGNVTPPPATGILGAQPGVVLAAGICGDIGGGPVPLAITISGGETMPGNGAYLQGPAPTASTTAEDNYSLVNGTHFPRGAKAVKFNAACRIVGTAGQSVLFTTQIGIYAGSDFANAKLIGVYAGGVQFMLLDASGFALVGFEQWIPRAVFGSSNGYADDNLYFVIQWGATPITGGALTRDTQNLQIRGWKL